MFARWSLVPLYLAASLSVAQAEPGWTLADTLARFSVKQARAAYSPERPWQSLSISPEQPASTLRGELPGGITLPPWATGARPPVSG